MSTGRRAAATLAALALAGALSGCASHKVAVRTGAATGVVPPRGYRVEGIASWYGPGYDGKRTSSGERYDQDGLTAAHFDWAFGTRVKVTLLSTGKSVVVRVNDRLPRKDRIIDLSKGAARRIGLIGPGTGKVRLEVVD